MTSYRILANGSYPYMVEVACVHNHSREIKLTIAKANQKADHEAGSYRGILVLDASRIFIGKSIKCHRTVNHYGPLYDGNAILARVEGINTYVLVSDKIMRFQTKAPIVTFVSLVDDELRTWPYAIDELQNVYLFKVGEHAMIMLKLGGMMSLTPDLYSPLIRSIPRVFVNKRIAVYEPRPQTMNESTYHLLTKNGKHRRLTTEDFCAINEKYGASRGFEKLELEVI